MAVKQNSVYINNTAAAALAVVAVIFYNLAYFFKPLAFLIFLYLVALFLLSRVRTTRLAFYLGLAIGMLTLSVQLFFFSAIFSFAAIGLWLVIALWTAILLLINRSCTELLGRFAWLVIPFVWIAWEYLRSEWNPLKFSWLNVGFIFSESPAAAGLNYLGVYGIGFVMMFLAATAMQLKKKFAIPSAAAIVIGLGLLTNFYKHVDELPTGGQNSPFIVGIQFEGASDDEVMKGLELAYEKYPKADIFVLGEYTFTQEIPRRFLKWCQEKKVYLIAGGVNWILQCKEGFENTVFVAGPDGKIIFSQAKSVPIQFFNDGRAAQSQQVWQSPWGKIGLCVCYDLGYVRVIDELIRQGAGSIICPVMDKIYWTRQEHLLHSRIGPCRAVEYRVSVLRVCSSGISQLITPQGKVVASAGFPGQGEMLAGYLPVQPNPALPLDRYVAPGLALGLGGLVAILLGMKIRSWRISRRSAAACLPDEPVESKLS